MAGERLLKAIQKASKEIQPAKTDLVFGVVTGTNPIKIKVENRFEIGADFLILSPFCFENKITVSTESGAEIQLLLWGGLKTGDTVIMLKVSNGQKYYVLQKD